MNDALMHRNVSDSFKTSDTSHTSNTAVNEDEDKYLLTDIPAEVGSQNFDFANYDENQLRVETKNERRALLPDAKNFNNYSRERFEYSANQEYSEYNFNEPSTSSGIRHWSETNA
ncbi:hypothetical protein TNIN_30591 [Trichonephila inaurata madagascariensis]|uniref:Uncharacterized protein n=1 Tax=Trichonephila inaurata madagascariensis TaxID=2747483 RepID=A0A8X6XBS1_9ARAC|nr:hypothetical protein TNIN_30591 [Trichonephila inaurata madagascariensis]